MKLIEKLVYISVVIISLIMIYMCSYMVYITLTGEVVEIITKALLCSTVINLNLVTLLVITVDKD